MNKGLIVGLSVLGTVTTMTGAVAVASKVPAVKDKITISYEDKVVVGTNSQNNTKYEEIIEQLRTENAEKESMITELNSLIQTSTARIEQLEEDNREKSQTISQLETDNQSKVSEIATLNASIEENNQRIAELEQSEEDKSAEILQLQAENQSKTSQIASLNATITSNEETIQELQTVKANNEDTISSLNARITSMGSDITALQQQIEVSNNSIDELEHKVRNYETALENYAMVTYVINNIETMVIQDIGTTANYHEKLPIGYIAGWSFNSEGTELVPDDYIVQTNDVLYAVFDTNAETIKLHFDFTEEDLSPEGYSVLPRTTGLETDYGRLSVVSIDDKNYFMGAFYSGHGYRHYSIANVKVMIDGVEHPIPNDGLFWSENDPFENYCAFYPSGYVSLLFYVEGESYQLTWTMNNEFYIVKDKTKLTNAYVSSIDFFLISENRTDEFTANYYAIADGTYGNEGQETPDGIITFTIEGVSYYAEEGMTWEEWVNSEYNTINFKIIEDAWIGDVSSDGVYSVISSGIGPSMTHDVIHPYAYGTMEP